MKNNLCLFERPFKIQKNGVFLFEISSFVSEILTVFYYANFSIITQVIAILALSLTENGVIFRYNHLRRGDYSGRTNFQNSGLALCLSEEEINLINENAIPRNTKHATKFGMTFFTSPSASNC